jgi:hypothetical protein
MSSEKRIGQAEFELALGLNKDSLDGRTRDLLDKTRLLYMPIDQAGQEKLQTEIRQQISDGFTVVGEHRAGIWRDAWQDHLDRFTEANYSLEALNPAFVGGTAVLRWQGAYVRGITERFELLLFEILRDWLFRTFLADTKHLYEFGSGSAFNVAAYAQLFPEVEITALDWAPAAVRIANLLRERLGMRINSRSFDFFAPDYGFDLDAQGSVLTVCALEQTGDRFVGFLDYLLSKRPLRVVHIEPTFELYDSADPHDQLAIQYHSQRKYLAGLLPHLQALEHKGEIRMQFLRRLRFGSRFHECFTVIVWEPAGN